MGDSMSTIINATTTNGVVIQPDNSGSLVLQTNSGTTAVTIDTSQRAAFVAGTAALPAITTTGDTNTGMFFPAADTIAFAEGGAEAMRLDASGNVGIGTTSPVTSYRLSIYDQTNGATNISGLALIEPGSATSYSYFKTTSQASADTRTIIGNGAASRAFAFETGGTERMRIASGGQVIIGSTTSQDTTRLGIVSSTSGVNTNTSAITSTSGTRYHWTFQDGASSTERGSITTNGSATAYNTSSDYRLKENIAPMTGALATVQALKPVTYTWKESGDNSQGFIAHELQAVVPDCVTGEKDAVETYSDEDGNEQTRPKYQSVDTSFLVATLTAAIQEQQTIINDLKARVETLEAK